MRLGPGPWEMVVGVVDAVDLKALLAEVAANGVVVFEQGGTDYAILAAERLEDLEDALAGAEAYIEHLKSGEATRPIDEVHRDLGVEG